MNIDEKLAEIERLWATENTFDLSNIDWLIETSRALLKRARHSIVCCTYTRTHTHANGDGCGCVCGLQAILDGAQS